MALGRKNVASAAYMYVARGQAGWLKSSRNLLSLFTGKPRRISWAIRTAEGALRYNAQGSNESRMGQSVKLDGHGNFLATFFDGQLEQFIYIQSSLRDLHTQVGPACMSQTETLYS